MNKILREHDFQIFLPHPPQWPVQDHVLTARIGCYVIEHMASATYYVAKANVSLPDAIGSEFYKLQHGTHENRFLQTLFAQDQRLLYYFKVCATSVLAELTTKLTRVAFRQKGILMEGLQVGDFTPAETLLHKNHTREEYVEDLIGKTGAKKNIQRRPVSCCGRTYPSVTEAAQKLGVSTTTINKRLKDPERKDYCYVNVSAADNQQAA